MKSLDQIIFVHIPRTAGTSISWALDLPKQPHFFARKHIFVRSDWIECYKFSFVRNPWDRAVSLFFNQNKNGDSTDFKSWLIGMIEEHGHPLDRNTEWEVTDQLDGTGGNPIPWKSQTDWLIDFDGNLCLDFIGRFENLYEDIQVVEGVIETNLILPHIRKTDHEEYQKYYKDQESKDIVADWHKKDIDNFGYSF